MAVVLNSFICKRPFFANKNITFANLLRTHVYLSLGSHVKVGRQIFRQKKRFSELRTQKRNFGGTHVGTLAALAIRSPYMDL